MNCWKILIIIEDLYMHYFSILSNICFRVLPKRNYMSLQHRLKALDELYKSIPRSFRIFIIFNTFVPSMQCLAEICRISYAKFYLLVYDSSKVHGFFQVLRNFRDFECLQKITWDKILQRRLRNGAPSLPKRCLQLFLNQLGEDRASQRLRC